MADYDFKSAKEFIELHKEHISEASLGMHEDWSWTAETVFEDGEFTKDLDKISEIAGIGGSHWATPTLEIIYKNGDHETKSCFIGKTGSGQPPAFFALAGVSIGQRNDTPDSYTVNGEAVEVTDQIEDQSIQQIGE